MSTRPCWLPNRPVKPYIPPDKREHKAMTIVAGLRCADGIVLCADQQVSAQGAYKYNECKINIETVPGEPIVFAYSGLPSLAREARKKIMERITQDAISEESVYQAADAVFTEMGRTLIDVDLRMLIATNLVFEKPTLLKFDGKGLHSADDYNFLGAGDSSLLRFLAETMYSPQMTIEDATNLAIYFIQKAEDYIDGCGGPIDVAVLSWGEGTCERLSPEDVQDRIKRMEKQERYLTALIIQKPFSSSPT